MRALGLFLATIFLQVCVYSQEYSFKAYSLAEGLPQSQVTCITQDQKGFLWVGTLGGLARFSGKNFQSYSVENGLLNNRISFLGIIRDTLWVGHENGVSKQYGNQFISYRARSIQEGTKFSAIVYFKGSYFMASNGGGIYEIRNNELVKIEVEIAGIDEKDEFDRIRDVLVIGEEMYVATRMGLFVSRDGKRFDLIKDSDAYSFSSMKYDQSIGLLLSSYGDGVFSYRNNQLKLIEGTDDVADGNFKHLALDYKGKIWLSTKFDGAIRIGKEGALQLSSKNGLHLDNVSCVFEDNTRSIWIGTEGKGLIRFAGESFIHYTTNSGLESDLVVSVVQDKQRALWFGTYASGILHWTKSGWRTINTGNGLSNNTVWASVMDDNGKLWFGTSNGLNIIKDKHIESWDVKSQPNLPGNKISALFKDSKGNIWIGGKDGVAVFSKGVLLSLEEYTGTSYEFRNVRDFTACNNEIYFVSQSGFHVIHSDKKITSLSVSETLPMLFSLDCDVLGNVWIGSEEGVFIYRNSTIKPFNYSDFTGSKFINFIQNQGEIMWVGTNNGLFRFTVSETNVFQSKVEQFGLTEGLVSLETNINSAFIDHHNNLWFGTSEGLMRFDRNKENTYARSVSPVVNYAGLSVNFQPRNHDWGDLSIFGEYQNHLTLNYYENRVALSFSGVTMANPDDLKYQYLLEGLNEEWSPPVSSNEVTFSSLSPGRYILKVRAISKTGMISNELSFPLVVNTPFYASWWFISLLVFILASIVYAVFKFKITQERNRRRSERLEFTSKLRALEQQSLNASMNRHFIFNALNSIQYFINTQDKLSANKYLSQFAKLIRKNLDSSATNENYVTLGEEIERLKLYLSLESMRFTGRFDYEFDIDPEIDIEMVKIPSMIFQPFVENSIIHGILPKENFKGLIKFSATKVGDIIEFKIEDNGVGYEKSIRHKSEQGDHQSRGMSITSSRIELLRKISGKTFHLEGPTDVKNDAGESIGTLVQIKIQEDSL